MAFMKQLQDKVIFLTGGTDGIGFECAKAYDREGAKLVIAAPGNKRLSITNDILGEEHLYIPTDVRIGSEIKSAIETGLSYFGRIDAIHNNAGIAHPSKTLHNTSEEEWDQLISTNLKSIYFSVVFGFEALKNSQGCILNTSSIVGEIGQELHAAYTATKGGINALTKSMALDYSKYNIRVNAISPAGVWTSMLEKWKDEQPEPAVMTEYLNAIHPLGYCPKGDVIADACVFLLSEKARFITGCIMPVTGGAELGYRTVFEPEQLSPEINQKVKSEI